MYDSCVVDRWTCAASPGNALYSRDCVEQIPVRDMTFISVPRNIGLNLHEPGCCLDAGCVRQGAICRAPRRHAMRGKGAQSLMPIASAVTLHIRVISLVRYVRMNGTYYGPRRRASRWQVQRLRLGKPFEINCYHCPAKAEMGAHPQRSPPWPSNASRYPGTHSLSLCA